jgi:hypothetical protein
MLRFPRSGESIPPLVQPLEEKSTEPTVAEHQSDGESPILQQVVEKGSGAHHPIDTVDPEPLRVDAEPLSSGGEWRRRKKHRGRGKSAENEWQQAGNRALRFTRRVPLAWIWAFSVLAVTGLLLMVLSLLQRSDDTASQDTPSMPMPMLLPSTYTNRVDSEAMAQLSQIQDAHQVIEAFFQTRKIEDLLPWLRPVDGIAEKVRGYYLLHPLSDEAFEGIQKESSTLLFGGRCFQTQILVKNQPSRLITLMKIGEHYRIDWESWVGWSEMHVASLRMKKPLQSIEVRVTVERESYYNYDFPTSMESAWQSYKITFPGDNQVLHAYVERSSPLHQQLIPASDVPSRPMILRVRYRDSDSHSSQVLIDSVVAEGWVKDMPQD